jgi:uncharacterized protein YcbX
MAPEKGEPLDFRQHFQVGRRILNNARMTGPAAKIKAIHRYPVKGLTPEPMARTELAPGKTVPFDRMYAIENGPSGFDAASPSYLPKIRFLMLMRNARLAELRTAFDAETHVLTVHHEKRVAAQGDLRTVEGRTAIERFFAEFSADELRGPPKVLQADGHSFSDVAKKVVSIINLASVAALEDAVGAPVNPLRFRGNLQVDGWPAWHEFDLLNREIRVGPSVRLKVVKRIVRCAATEVDPDTGIRDLPIPRTIMDTYGHADCGVYAEVIEGGPIALGDVVDDFRSV